MSFNIFGDHLNTRRQRDQQMFEGAFADLVSILGINAGKGPVQEKAQAARGALEQILHYYGATMPEIPDNITELEAQFDYALRATGFMRRRVELVGRWWNEAFGPLLGSTVDGDVVAIMPGRFSGYGFVDSKTGSYVKLNKETAKLISGEAFGFSRPLPARKLTLLDLWLYMMQSVSRADVLFVLAMSLLISLLGLFTPFMNKQIFDSVIPSGSKANILPVAALLTGAAIGTTFFNITRSLVMTRFKDKTNTVQIAAMMRIMGLPATFFKDFSAGELSKRYMSIKQLVGSLSDTVLTTGLTALFSFVFIFQMVNYGPSLVIPGLIIIATMLVFSTLTTIFQLGISRKRIQLNAKLSGLVFALFSGVQKIKLAGAEKRAFAKWAAAYKEEGKLAYSPPLLLRINSAIAGFIGVAGTLVLYFFAARSGISTANFIAFNTAYGAVSGAILSLGSIVMTVASIKPLLEMVQPILDTVPESSHNKKIVTSLSGNFEVNNLTFRYIQDGPVILDNINLKVRSGEYVAIVGKTGCGKSTLMRLLLGFEQPETGAIYFDGHDLSSLDVQSARQCVGVCLQNGKLFSGDIFSNIVITAPWRTLEDAWRAAELAGIAEDIRAMPMGMHTVISEGSGGISGGQRQRLLIARALIAEPRIILFDEATSALDNITQKHVADSLASLKCTRVVIAHRLSTIRHCDRIVVLDSGKIVEEGSFATLMEKQGAFYELARRQII